MGARQSKRSVDISATPKKDKAEGGAEEKLEKIDEPEVGKIQNGNASHPEETKEAGDDVPQVNGTAEEAKTEASEAATEKESNAAADKEQPVVVNGDADEKKGDVTTPESPQEEKTTEGEDSKDKKKKKDKSKKKWSFRSISFSRKDKNKPNMSREDSKTNDLAKEAPLPEVEGETTAEDNKEKSADAAPSTETPAAVEPSTEEAKKEENATATSVTTTVTTLTTATTPAKEDEEIKEVTTTNTVKTEMVVSAAAATVATEKKEEKKEEEIKTIETSNDEIVEKTVTVETSKMLVTTVTESSEIIVSSKQILQEEVCQIKSEEFIAPPLPASPPPTEAPPPTPNVLSNPQVEHEEVNGGGEGMAEMPEENGLDSGANKLDVDDDDVEEEEKSSVPKMNGHHEESPVKQVESFSETIAEKIVMNENNGEITTNDAIQVAE